MKRVDLVTSVVFFLLGVWVIWQSNSLPQFTVFGPGPEFMPRVAAILLLVLSALLFIQSLRGAPSLTAEFVPGRAGLARIGFIIGGLFLYTALLETVGYLLLTFAYAAFMLLALARYRWYVDLALAAVITFVFYTAFITVLGVPAPDGILDF